jgi:hypothetical protein
MAVVNSEKEADILRYLYFEYGPLRIQMGKWKYGIPEAEIPPPKLSTQEPTNAIVHIGFHDRFIEGEYLTVRSK